MGFFDNIKKQQERQREEDERLRLYDMQQSDPIYLRHYEYLNEIIRLYSIANAFDNKFSDSMEKCILLCKKDIAIAEEFRKRLIYYKEEIPEYFSFKRLAIIYDKRKQYNEAVDVCTTALKLGFTDNGGMYSRLSKLLKKAGGISFEAYLKEKNIPLQLSLNTEKKEDFLP